MKKLVLGLFIAFGISACSLGNDNLDNSCGSNVNSTFTGFPLLCNYSVKTEPEKPGALVVVDEEKLLSFFTKHPNSCPNPSDPTIDFTKNYLIGLFAGKKPTTGYSIKVTSIVENNCEIIVNLYEKSPQPGEPVSQTVTYPADYILIPKTPKKIFFNKVIVDNTDNAVIGYYPKPCTGGDCQNFFQLNEFNILKFQNVVAGSYDFNQYKYTATTKRGEYTLFIKNVPAEITALKGETKTYGTPDTSTKGGTYFELRQGGIITKIYIDNNDTADQSAAIKTFKKAIQDKITSLK
ncbi:protease complex subunit PrcB family protein [Flavobacterium poyangense]|uniref:protease complex subunit PrcB family protein n=1 Tax=Flavobacterium poyangense TaxID=2204302 RepID=UPI00141E9039|nr:protease complex subunit PrcB family protein [Flavobacterium sp. JXAS1]